jgi:hypothetical protein
MARHSSLLDDFFLYEDAADDVYNAPLPAATVSLTNPRELAKRIDDAMMAMPAWPGLAGS